MIPTHFGWVNPKDIETESDSEEEAPGAAPVAVPVVVPDRVDDTESDSDVEEAPVPAPVAAPVAVPVRLDDTESDSDVEEAPVPAPVAAPVVVRPNVRRNCRLFSMRLQRRSAAFAGKRARAVHEDDTEDDVDDESEMPAAHVQPEVVPAPKRVRKQAVLHNVSSF